MSLTKNDCYTSSGKYCACVEFHLDEEHRHGFHASQLMEYTLKPNPDRGADRNAPPQQLTLAFATADVVVLGWRLGRLADLLRENDLATVHVLPQRYADVDRTRPYVTSIIITMISKSPS